MKFVNRKHSEAMPQRKKDNNQKSKVFVSHSLCPCYRFLQGKCIELQRKGRINQVFFLGAVVTVIITKNSPAIKTCYHARNVPQNLYKRLILLSQALILILQALDYCQHHLSNLVLFVLVIVII